MQPNGKKVLLVEDDDNLASVYLTRLEHEGFNVRRVSDGEHALATAVDFLPDLVLLDMMMPNISGFDVLDILRNTPETADAKVVILSARAQDTDRDKAAKLGANDYLVKSQVVISDVIAIIKNQLQEPAENSSDKPDTKTTQP